MTTRTISQPVTFARAFTIKGLDGLQPAGTYMVETDEELIDELSFIAYRRVAVRMQLPVNPMRPGIVETIDINPGDLDAALVEEAKAAR